MGVRSRLASGLVSLSKVFGNAEPAAIAAGEVAAGMTPTRPFSPGEPIGPYDGYSRTPRSRDFVTGYNIASRPRTHERVSFDTLRGLVEAYDVAQMCIWHRIDSIRSLDWSLIAAKGYGGDTTDAIPIGMAALKKPDRQTPFANWLASYLYDILAYDAGALYRLRNRRGDAIGLRVVDGTSVAPLLDYWGNSPEPPAEAYVQYVQGLPWNWLTRDDLIYEPFRKRTNSPYGTAPLESIILNANTDLRFQAYFLQRFTEGNIPEAFASAPETWTPDQIEQFQGYWDSFMYGDQAAKHQIKWIPGGSSIAWSNDKDFSDTFSLFLMRKTAAAYHVVPADLGFTETVNKSSGESQADVQHRVGDLPLLRHVQSILTSFLQDDLGLPLQFAFDLGEEQADRLDQAQADKVYVEMGAISASDVRELRYGLPEPDGVPVPRFIFTNRSGPIPLSSLYAVAGEVDPQTAAPEPGAPLPHTVFTGAEGALPNPPVDGMPLAEQIYGPSALPSADAGTGPVGKDAAAAPTAGVTAETGIVGYDLVGRTPDDEDDEERRREVAKELAAFRTFRKARVKAARWRDFEFRALDPVRGRRLNQAGRAEVRKAAGEVAVAGLAVRAADTGRVLMLQRALDPEDPAGGTLEFPGGHLEGEESPLQGAWREWAEETGCIPPPGERGGSWTSADGVYQGIVWTVESENTVPVRGGREVSNPDDPDGDAVEAIMWLDPAQLPGNPAVRPELLESLPDVLAALGCPQQGDDATCPCGTPVVYDDLDGWQHADGSVSHDDGESVSDKMGRVAKAGDASPKAGDGQSTDDWPGWQLDQQTAQYWATPIAAALGAALPATQTQQLAADYLAAQQAQSLQPDDDGKDALIAAAIAWLAAQGIDLAGPLASVLPGVWTDGYAVGLTAARAVTTGQRAQRRGWQPGDTDTAQAVIGEARAGDDLAQVTGQAQETAQDVAESRRRDMARELVGGLLAGATAKEIGAALGDVLADAGKAFTVALTEVTRASGLAALFTYHQDGAAQVRWLPEQDDHVCADCLANEAAGSQPLGEPFPSGDTAPPVHPRCRCAVIPA